jgi:ubiquinone/menaquinone biosynthesis C-methylase UbiE
MKNSNKLNIGCGKKVKPGYINLDNIKLPGVDIVHNLNKYPWPFRKNTFNEVYCDNVLEHLDSIIKPMEEIWRISRGGGKVKIIVPIFPSVWAMIDPTHKQFFTYMTFNYFHPNNALNYYSKARFKILKRKIVFNKYLSFMNLINLSAFIQKVYYIFFSFLIPASFLHFELETIK